jgi:hypothetical protein
MPVAVLERDSGQNREPVADRNDYALAAPRDGTRFGAALLERNPCEPQFGDIAELLHESGELLRSSPDTADLAVDTVARDRERFDAVLVAGPKQAATFVADNGVPRCKVSGPE